MIILVNYFYSNFIDFIESTRIDCNCIIINIVQTNQKNKTCIIYSHYNIQSLFAFYFVHTFINGDIKMYAFISLYLF